MFKPQVEIVQSADSGDRMMRIVLNFCERTVDEAIFDVVGVAIKEGVRKHLMEDPQFRQKVDDAIQSAAASMPLEAITQAVKDAIKLETSPPFFMRKEK